MSQEQHYGINTTYGGHGHIKSVQRAYNFPGAEEADDQIPSFIMPDDTMKDNSETSYTASDTINECKMMNQASSKFESKDSPLQAFLRDKLQDSISTTQHSESTTTECNPGQQPDDDDASVVSMHLQEVFEPVSKNYSGSFSAASMTATSVSDFAEESLDFEHLTRNSGSAGICESHRGTNNNDPCEDSMSSLNEAFEKLKACMERSAQSRKMVKRLSDSSSLGGIHSDGSFHGDNSSDLSSAGNSSWNRLPTKSSSGHSRRDLSRVSLGGYDSNGSFATLGSASSRSSLSNSRSSFFGSRNSLSGSRNSLSGSRGSLSAKNSAWPYHISPRTGKNSSFFTASPGGRNIRGAASPAGLARTHLSREMKQRLYREAVSSSRSSKRVPKKPSNPDKRYAKTGIAPSPLLDDEDLMKLGRRTVKPEAALGNRAMNPDVRMSRTGVAPSPLWNQDDCCGESEASRPSNRAMNPEVRMARTGVAPTPLWNPDDGYGESEGNLFALAKSLK